MFPLETLLHFTRGHGRGSTNKQSAGRRGQRVREGAVRRRKCRGAAEARGERRKRGGRSTRVCSYMVEIQQRGIEFLRSVQKVGTSYRALGLAERSSSGGCPSEKRIDHGKVPTDVERTADKWRGFISDQCQDHRNPARRDHHLSDDRLRSRYASSARTSDRGKKESESKNLCWPRWNSSCESCATVFFSLTPSPLGVTCL